MQVTLLNAKNQFLCNDDVTGDVLTFNESRLHIVYQGVDHKTKMDSQNLMDGLGERL